MERLPFVDEHARTVAAAPERVWAALLSTLRNQPGRGLPRPLVAAWGLEQPIRSGDWTDGVSPGDTVPGFAVAETDPPRLLCLRGGHRFSRYELRFELDSGQRDRVVLRARTSAVFPGVLGRTYRGLVIGTGGHRIAVRRMLALIARYAERDTSADPSVRPPTVDRTLFEPRPRPTAPRSRRRGR